ncbi:MAG: beta-ketoacyl-[acyl-carrier-protein] synthase family protein [Ketobacteraceae bacterium]|nr:beta-ketoacyl-[acyl-carrier-protein] synthase family protein [Ketobacteraceae bacterium]
MSAPGYHLSALGVVCALGYGKENVLEGLLKGDQSGLVPRAGLLPDREAYVGAVSDAFLADQVFPASLQPWDSRNNRLLLAAFQEIATEVEAAVQRFGRARIGIVLGTSTSGVEETEKALRLKEPQGHWPEGYDYARQEFGDPAAFLARYLGTGAPAYCISTACSSSAKAFGSAGRLLDTGLCDAVIVGGVDSLCQLTLNGFASLESLSRSYCAPFSKDRDGINIGEAAALFLMTRPPAGGGKGICVLGVGESSDAYHISAPHPEGQGAKSAMRSALQQAGITADQVAYINLHGTATPQNDAMESKAVLEVLGSGVAASSTKSLTGHTLGAAGALETAFCWLLLSDYNTRRCLPPQITRGEIDDSLPALNLVGIASPPGPLAQGVMMSNSFAFGGSNASVILATGQYLEQQP